MSRYTTRGISNNTLKTTAADDDQSNKKNNTGDTNQNQNPEPSLKDIYTLIAKVDTTVSNLSSKFDNLDSRTTNLEKENTKLKEDIAILHTRLCSTEKSFNEIQQKQYENYITISNLPVTENENITELVIAAVALLQIEISKENISFCKRIGGFGGKFTPLIIVQFDSNTLKETILQFAKTSGPILPEQINIASSQSNSSNQKIRFGQYITRYTQQLLTEAKQLRSKHKIDFIWQNRGTVLIKLTQNSKTIHKIKTFEDLNKFITSHLSNK